MDLRQKALWGFVGAIIVTMVILASLSFFVIMTNYRSLEAGNVHADVNLVSKGIEGEIVTLKSNTPDWGAWDDTYAFVLGKKQDYVSVNLVDTTFRTLRANFIVITDKEGNIRYGQGYNLVADTPAPLRPDLIEELKTGRILGKATGTTGGVSGFLSLPDGPVIISAFPVLHSDYTGPEEGMVIMGRYVDDTEILHFTGGVIPAMSIRPFDRLAIPRDDLAQLSGVGDSAILVIPRDENMVEGQKVIRDIFGRDSLLLSVQLPRDIYQQGKNTIFIFILIQLVLLLVLSIGCILVFDKTVLSRMSTISSDITGITEKKDRSGRIRTTGNDELSRLAGAMNNLLEQIEKKQSDLEESEKKFREIFNSVNDSIELYEIRSDGYPGKFLEVNDVTCNMLQYTREELLRHSPNFFSTGAYSRPAGEIGAEILTLGHAQFETERRRNDGTVISVEINAHAVVHQGKTLVLAVARDITERKKADAALKQVIKKLNILSGITRHDILNQLTTLRGYIELSGTLALDEKLRGFIAKEENAAIAIQEQISFTRDYENIGVHSPQWQDVNKTILRAITPLQPLPVKLVVDVNDTEIFADPMLERVFYNLTENAIRYGGTITTISFTRKETEDGLIILCEDDGEGIPLDEKENVFNRKFFKHTGLGLFLVREILGMTGIGIQETGEPGNGARFEISVPKRNYRFTR